MVRITLDKERNLNFTLNAMIDFEESTGRSLMGQESMEKMSMKDLRTLLWACLRDDDTELTQEQVGAMVTMDKMEHITESLTKAFKASMPEPGEESGGKRKPKR